MAAGPKLDSLEERLMDHAKSFDSLLSLMPAEVYFGKDNSDQWQKKKQTKEEKRAAKKAKLDPDNAKTAKDIFDEQAANAKKRKREDDGGGDEEDAINAQAAIDESGNEQSVPIFPDTKNKGKKQKRDEGVVSQDIGSETKDLEGEDRRKAKAEKAREKRERKKAKAAKKAAKVEAKKARKQQKSALVEDPDSVVRQSASKTTIADGDQAEDSEDESERDINEIEPIEMDNGFAEEDLAATASPSPTPDTSMFDAPNQDSGSSSISSIVPPPPEKISLLPKIDTFSGVPKPQDTNTTDNSTPLPADSTPEELKARLAARIEALRTARKASDPSNTPQNRQELIESRRRKEEERKAHKRKLRRKAREEEAAQRSESLARGSPLLSNTNSPLLSPGSPAASSENNNFSFGRISFAGGQHAKASLDAILTPSSKQKGPSDPKTALQAAEKRQSRLAALDPEKQADIAEKDVWLNARKRAHGERIRDDTSLLKKTLKRKEKQKKRSEKEWNERLEGVKKGQAVKQKKREANLQKRRDEKGGGSKAGKSKAGGKGGGKKKKARPGFEGSFKAKAPSSAGGGRGGGEKPRRR